MTAEGIGKLTERLKKIGAVSQFDRPEEPQAATLAHSLKDLEKSFREILDTHLPKLLDETIQDDELNDVLLDIGEELRHVLYHIKDPRYFSYLHDDEGEKSKK
jgi:hypothetical protein